MAALTVSVQVAFSTSPDSTAPVWTDISQYVDLSEGISITHGRNDPFGQVQPGRCEITLDNSDGRFTPGRSGSPYYPNVKMFRRLRVQVTDGVTTWTRFDGRVDSWPLTWAPAGKYAKTRIVVIDRMKSLTKAVAVSDPVTATIHAAGPAAYWRMGDAAGTTEAVNYEVTSDPMIVQDDGIIFGSATGPGTDSLTAVSTGNVNAGQGSGWLRASRSSANPFIPFGTDYSMVCFFLMNGTPVSDDRPVFALSDDQGNDYGLYIHGGSTGWVWPPDMSLVGPIGSINYADNATHFFGMTHSDATSTGIIYMDDQSENSGAGGHTLNGNILSASVFGSPGSPYRANSAVCAHVAIFNRVLSATEMADIRAAGLDGFWGDSTGTRASRILTWAGVPTSQQACESGRSYLDVQDLATLAPLDLIQECEDSEDGVFFIATDGTATFHGRDHTWNQASAFTLTAGQYDDDLSPVLDDYGVMNDVTVSAPNAADARATDATSVADIGTYANSVDTALIADQAEGHARYLLQLYKDPMVRWPSVTVDVLTQTSVRAGVIGAEVGTVFTVSGLPTQAPASSVTLIVQGWEETLKTDEQSISFNTSVLPSWQQSVMVLGDATRGVIGSNYLAGDK